MRRSLVLVSLFALACGPRRWPPFPDAKVVGVCNNLFYPVAVGNHWEFDVSDLKGKRLGATTLEVIGVDEQRGRVTVRSLFVDGHRAQVPRTTQLECDNGWLSAPSPAAASAATAQRLAQFPAAGAIAQPGQRWSQARHFATLHEGKRLDVDTRIDASVGPTQSVAVPAGRYRATMLRHQVTIAPRGAAATTLAFNTFVAPNVGIVRAEWPDRVLTLRSFRPRSPVTLDDDSLRARGLRPPPAVAAPKRATMKRAGLDQTCYCGACPVDVWGNPEPCDQCDDPCICAGQFCGCEDSQPPCPPPPPPPVPQVCPGDGALAGDLCPHSGAYIAEFAGGVACREEYWWGTGGLGWLSGLVGGPDANSVCGLHGMGDEWELVTEGRAVGVVSSGYDAAMACDATKGMHACASTQPDDGRCPTPNVSENDACVTHRDKDFEFDIALPNTPESTSLLGTANLRAGGESYGRDVGVEWERMYLFPEFSTEVHNPLTPVMRSADGKHALGVPWPGDTVAIHGAVIADCGHPNAGGDGHARTELHPPTAIAWIHQEASPPHTYTLWLRASSHATFPRPNPRNFPGKLHETLPLPDGAAGPISNLGVQCDYLVTSYDNDQDDSCSQTSWQDVSGHLDFNAPDACAQSGRYFNVGITPGAGSVQVDVDPLNDQSDEDSPYLIGMHATLCIPDCPNGCGYPATNGCGLCECANGLACEPGHHTCCDRTSACAGQACGTPVCDGELRCLTGACDGGLTFRAGTCVDANGCPAGQPLCQCEKPRASCRTPGDCTRICSCVPSCDGASCGDDDGCHGRGSCYGDCDEGTCVPSTADANRKYHCIRHVPPGGQTP